ncbi:MAG: class I SAM-dependent methyltransferase [Candidatus Pacebacteria bacterium]|nr:class I SAM-dependent methyltransferase [Candidatus Paceibacterota bacterium]
MERELISDQDKKVFDEYVESLNLSLEDFNKDILDVGSGFSEFAKYARENNISSSVFSLDPIRKMEETEKSVKGIVEKLPFRDESFDLIISHCAIPNIFIGEDLRKIEASFLEMMRVLKKNGEIRLGNVLKGDIYPNQRDFVLNLNQTLDKLKEEFNVEIEERLIPNRVNYEYLKDGSKRGLSKSYFVKIKKIA